MAEYVDFIIVTAVFLLIGGFTTLFTLFWLARRAHKSVSRRRRVRGKKE